MTTIRRNLWVVGDGTDALPYGIYTLQTVVFLWPYCLVWKHLNVRPTWGKLGEGFGHSYNSWSKCFVIAECLQYALGLGLCLFTWHFQSSEIKWQVCVCVLVGVRLTQLKVWNSIICSVLYCYTGSVHWVTHSNWWCEAQCAPYSHWCIGVNFIMYNSAMFMKQPNCTCECGLIAV